MASVTVDIQAKVVGYEASLKAMKDAFSKIDPGTEIGKSLERAIKYAENQLKGLNKNLTPRATSDTQIDAIVEKTNRAGEAIQEVINLMQKVNIGDIDFSKFDSGIGKLMESLSALEDELGTRVSEGFKKAIEGSTELNEAFKNFNIDIKDKSAGKIFEEVSEKAKQAAADTEAAKKVLDAAQKDLNSKQTKLNQLESNPIYNKDALKQDLNNLASEYIKTFDSIKETIRGNLNNLLGGNEAKADKMMEAFTQGLSPQTLKDHLMKLKDSLQKELKEGNSAKDIYSALLGGDVGSSGNAQAVTTKLLAGLNKVLPTIKEEFQTKFQDIISSLTTKEAGNISVLMDEGDLEGALKTMLKAIERAYSTAVGEVKKGQQAVADAMKEKASAQEKYDTAASNQKDVDGVVAQLTQQLENVQEQNKDLQNQINELKSQISEKKSSAASKIRSDARENGLNVENWKIGQEEAKKYQAELDRVQAKEKLVGKIEGVVQRWFSIYAAVRMVNNAIRSVISTVQELDKTITEIAIVTDMTQDELWGQMKSYTDMARQYAASISGVYQVSQLYYQQGLQTADVMALTEETLKMARISGLGYAEATDYMTNAVRSFKMEMTDAQRVVDVYSEIAASSATSTTELASAMSKTASSAEAVGSSFENTTAMMAVMIEATRESAENIGSAMKSIISRYGEMTADPAKLMDSEGQEMSLNKVDKALKSVGITIQDSNHQFRDFDEVITELAGKWDTIDTNTQRYIATVMAGNRQQSRFLALVSNGERLAELSEAAANSQDTATLQVLKTMDSIEAKTQQFKTSLQSLYTDTGIENLYKGFLDIANNIVKSFTEMSRIGKAPVLAILNIGTAFASLANVVTNVFALMKVRLSVTMDAIKAKMTMDAAEGVNTRLMLTRSEMEQIAEAWRENEQEYNLHQKRLEDAQAKGVAARAAMESNAANVPETHGKVYNTLSKHKMALSTGLNVAGLAFSAIGANSKNKTTNGVFSTVGSAAQGAGLGLSVGGPWGAAIGGALGLISGAISNWTKVFPSLAQQIKDAQEDAVNKNNTYIQKVASTRDLSQEIEKLKKLESARYDSVEAEEAYNEAANKLAETYPNLIENIDEVGNVTIDLDAAERELTNSRQKSIEAAQEAAIAEYKAARLNEKSAEKDKAKDVNAELSKTQSALYMALNPEQTILKDYFNYARPTEKYPGEQGELILDDDEFYSKMLSAFSSSSSAEDFIGKLISEKLIFEDSFEDSETIKAIELFYQSKDSFDYGLLQYISGLSDKLQSVPDSFTGFINSWQEETGLTESMFDNEELIQDALNILETSSDNTLRTIASIILSTSQDLGIVDKELLDAQQQTSETISSGVLKNINAIHSGKDNSFLKEMEGISKIMAQQGTSAYTGNTDKEYENYINNELPVLVKNWDKQWSEYWENLNSSEKERFNNLIKNYSQYSKEQARAKLEDLGVEDVDNVVDAYYDDSYNFDKFEQRMINKSKETENKLGNVINNKNQAFYQSLGESELLAINNIYDKINNLIRNNSISQSGGKDLYAQFEAIGQGIAFSSLPEEIRESAEKVLYSWEDFSINGILTLAKSLEELGAPSSIVNSTKQLISKIPVNLESEIQTFFTSTVSSIEDFEKAVSNATKGMDLKSASAIAQKLGKSLSDFDFKDGKFFFDDFAAIRDAYLGDNEEYISELTKEAQAQATKFEENKTTVFSNGLLDLGFSLVDLNDQIFSEQELRSKLEQYENQLIENGFTVDEIVQAYSKFQQRAADETDDFVEWVGLNINKELAETIGKVNEYTNDQIARAALSTGDFTSFLDQVLPSNSRENAEKRAQLQLSLKSGNIDTVLSSFPEYASDILKYYQDINKNIYDKLISGLDSQQYINADEFSAETLQSLETAGLVEKISGEGSKAIYKTLDKMTSEQLDLFAQTITNSNLVKADKDKMLTSIHTEKYEDNIYEGLSGVVDNFDKFSYEAGQKLANSLGTSVEDLINTGIINVDEVTGDLSISYEQMRNYLASNMHNMTIKQYNELRAKLEAKANKENDKQIFNDIVQNRNKLSEDNIAALGTILNKGYIAVTKMLHQNADGTYTLDLATIQKLINDGQVKVNEELNQLIANEIDTIISSLTGLGDLQNKGTANVEDMQKRVAAINQQSGQNFSMQDLFVYDEQLNGFVYSTQGLQVQAASLAAQLETLKSDTERNADEIWAVEQSMKNIAVQMANNIDFSSVLDLSIGDPARDIKFDELKQAIEDYNIVLAEIGETSGLNATNLINALRFGGENAVRAAEAIAKAQGKTLSANDVEAAYRNHVSNFVNAIDTVIAQPGEIVDHITAQIISANGGKINELGDTGQYVVETAANLYEAYNDLLHRMAATGEATLADLNKVAALALENRDGEQQVIDALGDAAGMTFTRFGEILANAGIQLTENMVNDLEASGIIDLMGGNKMKIVDFQAFADLMQWDANSEEYISAFKSYNDSLIEMNRQAERNILEEAESIADAKGGDWINLTQMYDKIFEPLQKQVVSVQQTGGNAPIITTAFDKLNRILKGYGANLEDGILKLDDFANIPAIMQEIAKAAEESGGLLSSELAELADTVADVIKGYADLISGAISGSLSNIQAEQLQDWASTNGIGKLNFTETADGLKVATDQAFELVAALRQVDSMQGKLTFDNLVDSLSVDKGGKFENISKTTAEIGKLNTEYENNKTVIENLQKAREHADTNAKANIDKEIAGLEQKNSKLRDQIGLYQQIQQRQSIDPAQYNFMDRDLPDTMQGPINYWNSVGQAFSAMNESSKTGRMEIQDFYNIVNEMENLANTSGQVFDLAGYKIGGSASEAAKLIQDGMGALDNIDGKGVKVNLQNLGVDFASGADGAKKNFTDGVHALAESQIAMLDAAIQVLEVVVAMEKLGDIDVDSNNVFSIGDIFKLDDKGNPIPEYTEKFQQYATDLLDAAKTNEDLRKGLENFSINGVTLKEMFEDATDGIKKLNISEEAYFAVMEAFVNAAKNGDYNLDTIQDSVWEILDKTLPDGSVIDMGDRSIVISGGTHTVIDWKSEDTKAAEKQLEDYAKKNNQTTKQALIDAFTKVQNGTSNQVEMEAVLIAKGLIKVDNETNEVEINGHKYKSINEADAKKEIAELALTEVGANKDTIVSSADAKGNITATGKVKVGQTELDVEYRDGKVIYKNDKGQEFNTVQALADQEIIDKVNDFKKQLRGLSQEDKKDAIAEYTKIVTAEVNYKYNLSTKVSLDGTEQQIRETLALGRAEIERQIEEGKKSSNLGDDGKYHVTLSSGLEVSGFGDDFNADSVIQEAISSLGIDGLIAGVSEGIKQAFASEDNIIGEAIASGITTALSNYTITIDNAGNIVFKPKGDGAEIDKPSAETAAETAAEKVTDLNIPSVDAKITKLNITDVQDAGMGSSGLVNQLGKDLFGSKSFTIPSADAAVTKLTITSVTDSEYKAGDNAVSPTIDSLDAAVTNLKISADKIDVESIKQQITDAFKELNIPINLTTSGETGELDTSSLTSAFDGAIKSIVTKVGDISTEADKISADKVTAIQTEQNKIETTKVAAIQAEQDKIKADKVEAIQTEQNKIEATKVEAIKTAEESIESKNVKEIGTEESNIGSDNIKNVKEYANTIDPAGAKDAHDAINSISFKSPSSMSTKMSVSLSSAKGNVALAGGKNTLMGELGPELVVSHGHYFLAGQSGAEFVNLDKDAIVFNHLQTQRLLQQGSIGNRGRAITNERNAVSFATGNAMANPLSFLSSLTSKVNKIKPQKVKEVVLQPSSWMLDFMSGTADSYSYSSSRKSFAKGSGPAMASASAALAALKQLRSMWQSLANATLKDMGGLGGASGGGGGGGGGGDTAKAIEGIAKDTEKWYNWLKLIETTQNKINILTKKYQLLEKTGASSQQRATNLQEQAKNLQQNISTRQNLIDNQKIDRKKLIRAANKGFMGAFYHADPETGQISLSNDDAFGKYIATQTGNKKLKKQLKQNGKIEKGTKITYDKYNEAEVKEKTDKAYEKWLKTEEGKKANNQQKQDKKKEFNKTYSDKSGKLEIKKDIKTGKDLMEELQRTKNGNLVHDAKQQYVILDAMGLVTKDLMAGIDTKAEGWEAQVVESFYEKVEKDKNAIEGLNDSIQEQSESILDDQIALEEINDQLKEMATPVAGVTEHLERWYNWIQAAASAQNELNLLTAKYNNLSLDSATTTADLLKNLQDQQTPNQNNLEAVTNELKLREDQLKKDKKKLRSSAVVKKGIYKFDETTGRFGYDLEGDKFKTNLTKAGVKIGKDGKAKFKVTKKEILTDSKGNQLTEAQNSKQEYEAAEKDYNNFKLSGEDEIRLRKLENKEKTGQKMTKEERAEYNHLTNKRKASDVAYNRYIEAEEKYEKNKNNSALAYRESTKSVSVDVSDPEKFIKDLTSTDGNNNFIHSAEQVGEILKQAGFEDLLKEVNGEFFDTSTQEGLTAAATAWMESVKDIPGVYNESLDAVEQLRVKQEEAKQQITETNQQMIELTRRTSAVIDNHEAWYNIARKIERVQLKINKLTIQYENLTKKLGDNTSQQITNLNKQAKTTRTSINYQEKQLEKQKEVRDANAEAAVKRYGDFYTFNKNIGELRENTAKAGLGKIKYKTGSLKMNADGTYAVNEDENYIYDEKASSNSIDFTGKSWAWIKNELTSKDKYNPERSKYTADELRQITLQIPGYKEKIAQYAGLQTLDGLAPDKLNEIVQEYWESMVNAKDATAEESDAIKEGENNLEKEKGTLLDINNSIRELLKPTAGVTEHLDSWYNLTRKTVIAQQELNKLTAKFSNLEKKPGDNAKAMAENLRDQGEQYRNNLDTNKEIITARKKDLTEERKKVKNNKALSKLLSFDENKNLVYSENKISGLNGKTISVNEIARDKNGHEIRIKEDGTVVQYGQEGYEDEKNYVKTTTKKYNLTGKGGIFKNALDENGDISAKKFVEILTETDAAGNAKLSLEQQQAILEQIGITGEDLTQFGDFENWDEATAEQRKDAVANYLKAVPEAAKRINGLKDEVVSLQVENINLEGNILDVNNQLKELATIAAGIQNPFEQWHSWLQKIKQEQNQLNILTQQYGNLEKERVNNGAEIAANLRSQLENLKQQQATNQSYLEARQTDYNELINTSNWTKAQKKFFQVDKNGQLQYNNKEFEKQIENNKGIELTGGTDGNGVYNYRNIEETIDFSATGIEDFLDKLTKQNADNSMVYNADQQFAILKAFGFSDLMQFDSSGNPIFQNGIENATKEEREAAVKTVLDNLKGFQEKVESSADDLQGLKEKGIELTGNVIDIKNQIQDNEIELENKILQAIEDREQKRIDDLKEQKDMLSEAADNFLNGLNEQLSKERDMYEKQESQDELTKLQRQLAILQRSGGSSSQIRSLQEQIKSQQKDMYFDERQDQIDAIKEASDKQIEKLDRQIQIAEETLAFNKENGLYWKEVREIMKLDSDKILSFIETNLAERNSQSTLQADLAITDDGKIVGTYTGTRGMTFKTGGLADYTGPAWLDGTKNKPESVLNAEQTSFLRNKLIDNLESFSLAISQFTNGTLSNNILGDLGENAGINIEQLDFVMKVDSLANDYDAKRAGQQAFDEMVRIARKAGNRSISRR